jgi:hypothetical protein
MDKRLLLLSAFALVACAGPSLPALRQTTSHHVDCPEEDIGIRDYAPYQGTWLASCGGVTRYMCQRRAAIVACWQAR